MSNIVKSPTSFDIPFGDVKCYVTTCGFDGNASSGRYLEFTSNVDSNQSGFVTHVTSTIVAATLAVQASSTITFTVYQYNGITETTLGTVSTSASKTGSTTSVSWLVPQGREIRVKCTSGSASRPVCVLYIVT